MKGPPGNLPVHEGSLVPKAKAIAMTSSGMSTGPLDDLSWLPPGVTKLLVPLGKLEEVKRQVRERELKG